MIYESAYTRKGLFFDIQVILFPIGYIRALLRAGRIDAAARESVPVARTGIDLVVLFRGTDTDLVPTQFLLNANHRILLFAYYFLVVNGLYYLWVVTFVRKTAYFFCQKPLHLSISV
jgi:hypothetical protein